MKPKYAIIKSKMTKAIPKSISFDMTGAMGMTNLGKYTFVIMPDELNKLPLELDNAPEKYAQGTRAV